MLAMLIGELVAPRAEQMAQERRSVALRDRIELSTRSGFWVRDGNSFINIRTLAAGNDMRDVFIYEFDEGMRLRVSTRAASARYDAPQWRLSGIVQSRLDDDAVTRHELGDAIWQSLFEPDLVNVVSVKPESLSALGLRRYITYLGDNGLDTSRFELALWHKFTYPLATAVMIFLAIPLVLGRLKSVGVGQRIVVGVMIGIGFHVLNQTSSQLGLVYGFSAGVSALLPTVLFLVAGVWMMQRLR
jgi:lipopolysaccharide export system permease protein